MTDEADLFGCRVNNNRNSQQLLAKGNDTLARIKNDTNPTIPANREIKKSSVVPLWDDNRVGIGNTGITPPLLLLLGGYEQSL